MSRTAVDGNGRSDSGKDVYDVAIVGGGPAGLSAALMLGRALRRVIVLDAGEPRNAPAAHMHAFLGHDGLPPRELLARGRREIAAYGVTLVEDSVVGANPATNGDGISFDVELGHGSTIMARRLLLAGGARDVLPDIPGLADLWGTDVHICPYCHGYEVRGKPLAVIATGEHSVLYALMIRNWTSDLIFFEHERAPLTHEEIEQIDAMGVRRVSGKIMEVVSEQERLTAIRMENGERFERAAIFLGTRLLADTTLPGQLGLAMNGTPQGVVIDVDPQGRTNVPGVWAAGNATNPSLQVVGAAAAGNVAGGAINMDLIMEDTGLQVRLRRERRGAAAPK